MPGPGPRAAARRTRPARPRPAQRRTTTRAWSSPHQYQPRIPLVCDERSIEPVVGGAHDEADGPVEEQVVPRPVDEHYDAAAEADHVDEVDGQPHQPAQEPGEANRPELRDRRVAADRGHDSRVLV